MNNNFRQNISIQEYEKQSKGRFQKTFNNKMWGIFTISQTPSSG